ncbi:branched-chain-amino-acid aminotransferase 5, chloroplastic-like [Heracleum sosnowskyi]|uniref:Branched-chain-amino-acid aminotransferase 5, chloroplastic-like n=1 Tax=Heracleum sosnowskyi TaxID=360622 RepID=A0AAD8HE48_9APIA|nr:branched-chain-amino-acid aminotransferase 5, chloroplastic-like [Heracleum sosnowskyi]
MVYNNQELMFRRKLEQEAELQQAIEYQGRSTGVFIYNEKSNFVASKANVTVASKLFLALVNVILMDTVKDTVLANERWVPPPGKGSLYIRPLLMGSGSVLSLAPAPEFTFLIYVSPVGNYFKDGLSPIDLMVETGTHRATPGGTGCVKTIGNYAAVLKAQSSAKAKGYSDVLYLDHSCAVFYLFHGAAGFKNHLD